MQKLPISVIITAKNAEGTIEQCLVSVVNNHPAEIIVIDGLSRDRTVDISQRYTDKVYSDDGRGESYAHQMGAEIANQEYIVFVDADIIAPENTFKIMLNELKTSKYLSIQAKIRAAYLKTYWERAIDWNISNFQKRQAMGLSTAITRKSTIKAYPFDPSLVVGGEDYDFQMRVEKDGYKLGISSAFVLHQHQASLKKIFKQRIFYGQDKARFILKYGLWNAKLCPPLITAYWICVCIGKGRFNFIPYFLVDCISQSFGMLKGMCEIIYESVDTKTNSNL